MTQPSPLFLDAVRHHEAGNIGTAERLYRKVLDKEPRNADAWYLAGFLAVQRRKLTSALLHFEKAVALRPDFADALLNRGNVLLELERPAEAASSFQSVILGNPLATEAFAGLGMALARQRDFAAAAAAFTSALGLSPDHLAARAGLANALRQLGQDAEAVAHTLAYAKARNDADLLQQVADEAMRRNLPPVAMAALQGVVALRPKDGTALCLMAKLLLSGGLYGDAEAAARRAIAAEPELAFAHGMLGQSLFRQGRNQDAATALTEANRLDPADTEARHFLSLITGRSDGEAQLDYVRNLFDGCAESFERILVDDLAYSAPWVLGEQLSAAGALANPAAIVDLGCGTGLCGTVLKPHASRLDGVDLAPRMVEICRDRGLYDEVAEAELVDFLDGRTGCYDIAVAADVLIYVGESSAVFTATRKALRAGGWFAFSVEATEAAPVAGLSSGRFAHSPAYIRDLAAKTGFAVESERPMVLRRESGSDIGGLAFVLVAR